MHVYVALCYIVVKLGQLKREEAKMVRWMCSVRSEEKISAEELKTRLKLMSMGGYRIEDRNSLVT